VNLIHLNLVDVGVGAFDEGSIDHEMDDQISAENNAGEGMEPSEQKIILPGQASKMRLRGAGLRQVRNPFVKIDGADYRDGVRDAKGEERFV
jgi:hypothetical protein